MRCIYHWEKPYNEHNTSIQYHFKRGIKPIPETAVKWKFRRLLSAGIPIEWRSELLLELKRNLKIRLSMPRSNWHGKKVLPLFMGFLAPLLKHGRPDKFRVLRNVKEFHTKNSLVYNTWKSWVCCKYSKTLL